MKKIFLVLLFVFSSAFADTWRNINDLSNEIFKLNLTKEQKQGVDKLLKQYYSQLRIYWKKIDSADKILMDEFRRKDSFSGDVRNMFVEIQTEKVNIDIDFLSSLNSILDKDQRKKLSDEFSEPRFYKKYKHKEKYDFDRRG